MVGPSDGGGSLAVRDGLSAMAEGRGKRQLLSLMKCIGRLLELVL